MTNSANVEKNDITYDTFVVIWCNTNKIDLCESNAYMN